MPSVNCHAVFFDLDGVLVESMPLIERILRQWALGHGLDADEVMALSHGRRDVDLIRAIAPHLDAEAGARAGAIATPSFSDLPGAAASASGQKTVPPA